MPKMKKCANGHVWTGGRPEHPGCPNCGQPNTVPGAK